MYAHALILRQAVELLDYQVSYSVSEGRLRL